MSTSTFSIFASIFGFITAAISLLAFTINVCRSHLPSNRIRELESLLDETETCFKKAVEDGLLTELLFVEWTEHRLAILRSRAYGLRSRVYGATNLRQDYLEFFRGTSSAIGTACAALKKLRAQVIKSSEQGHYKLMDTQVSHLSSAPTQPVHTEGRPNQQIYRPRSCPPALEAWGLAGARGSPAQITPTAPSGSDVRTVDTQMSASNVHTSVTLEPGI